MATSTIRIEETEDVIKKVSSDGGTASVVLDDVVSKMTITDGIIYFVKEGNLYKMDTEALKQELIFEGDIASICYYDEFLYFADHASSTLIKLNTANGGTEIIYTKDVSYVVCYKDRVYFCEGLDSGKIVSIDLYGGRKTVVSQYESAYLNIKNERIYYKM